MARIRSLKPEFWSSPSLPSNPWARLLFQAMWNWADDNGVGTCNERELMGFAFPNDEHTLEEFRRMLVEIRRVFDVDFYTVGGRPYYSIPTWEQHQKFDRRSKGKHPGPEHAETILYQEKLESSTETHESTSSARRDSVAGTGEQGNRGKDSSSELSDPERIDVKRLVTVLVDSLRARGVKTPKSTTSWEKTARLLLDTDDRSLDEALAVLEWSQRDEFWSKNILSMAKFRDKYDQLRLKADIRPTVGLTPEDFLRDCWQNGTIAPITDRCGRKPDCIRWPDPMPDDFDRDMFLVDFRRGWIEENRAELVEALRGRL